LEAVGIGTLFSDGDGGSLEDAVVEGYIDELFNNPEETVEQLRDEGYSAEEAFDVIAGVLAQDPDANWEEARMTQGTHTGQGAKIGDGKNRLVLQHPGTWRHFDGQPYIKISSSKGGTTRVPFPR
jgi:hypothetical protein